MTNKPETITGEDPWAKSEWLSAELDRVRQRCADLEGALTACAVILSATGSTLRRVRDRGKIADAPEIVFAASTARLLERDYGAFSVSRDVAYIAAFASCGNKGVAALDAIERVISLAPEG
jgi:hypothetical protein